MWKKSNNMNGAYAASQNNNKQMSMLQQKNYQQQLLMQQQQQLQMQQQQQQRGASGYYGEEYGSDNDEEWVRLDEEMDENYEPTEADVREYAHFLGMDLEKDKKYFYIAKEGLKAPLPEQWQPYQNKLDDQVYYVNAETGEKQLEHPCDEFYKKKFEDSKLKDQQKQAELQLKSRAEKQDMNEGFVGDSNVLDSSMNGGMGLNGSFLNEESDEQAQMRNTVERELNEDQMQFEADQLNKYKQRNVELEGIRKKEQKENEKNIEKDLKDLKKQVKTAEDDRKKVLIEKKKIVKKAVEGQIQEDFQAAKVQQEADIAHRKEEIEDLEKIQLDKEASAFERDRKDGLEAKSRKLENARRDRSEAQRKFDQQFKDQRNKVNNQFQSFRDLHLKESAEKLSVLEKEQQKYLKEEQNGLKETNLQLERQETDTTESKIIAMKQTLKKTKEKIELEAADRQQKLMNSIQAAHKLQISALHAQNEESKIEKALESENELKKKTVIEQVQNRIQAERQELMMKGSLQSIEIAKEVQRKYDSQREQLKREGAEKQKKLKETFKSNSELDESAFELICTKQGYQSNIEENRQILNTEQRILQKEQEAIDKLKEELQIILELQSTQQTINQSRVFAGKQQQKQVLSSDQDDLSRTGDALDTQELFRRNASSLNLNILQLSELEKRIEKLNKLNDEREKELKQLEITKQQKKEDVVNRRKANLEFQKELILAKQKMKIQKLENASDQQKFQQFQDLVKHLQNTLAEQQEQQAEQQRKLEETLKKQAELHEEQQLLKEQQISQLLQFQQQQSVQQQAKPDSEKTSNMNKIKDHKKQRKQSGEDTEQYTQNQQQQSQQQQQQEQQQQYKSMSFQQRQSLLDGSNTNTNGNIRRMWQNNLIMERNILIENKQQINSKKQHIAQMEEQIQKDQLSLNIQLNSAPSELKKSVLEQMEQNMQQQIKRIETEISSLQEMEIVFALKDQQLSAIEKLYDQATTQDIIGNASNNNINNNASQQQFNQQTFQQLYNLYSTLPPVNVGASSVIEAQQQKQLLTNNLSTAWKTILANNMPTASLLINGNSINPTGIASQQQQSQQSAAEVTSTMNQGKPIQQLNNYMNASSIGQNNPSQMNNNVLFQNASGRYDVKGALETLRNKYAIPGNASSVIDAPQLQVNHLRKKIAEGSNSSFVAYNNWVTNIKSQLNQQILEGPFTQYSYNSTIL